MILLLTDRRVHGNRLGARAAICPAIVPAAVALAIEVEAQALVTTGREEAEAIASATETSRVAGAAAEMPSEEDPAGMTDRALAPTAVVVHRAWDLEVAGVASVAEAVVVVGGAGR